jgi:hypothetical protein
MDSAARFAITLSVSQTFAVFRSEAREQHLDQAAGRLGELQDQYRHTGDSEEQ